MEELEEEASALRRELQGVPTPPTSGESSLYCRDVYCKLIFQKWQEVKTLKATRQRRLDQLMGLKLVPLSLITVSSYSSMTTTPCFQFLILQSRQIYYMESLWFSFGSLSPLALGKTWPIRI